MTAFSAPAPQLDRRDPPAVTLGELLTVLAQLTDDEDEVVGTALHMVEQGSVRLVGAEAL